MNQLDIVHKKQRNFVLFILAIIGLSSLALAEDSVINRWNERLKGNSASGGTSFSALRTDLEQKLSGNIGKLCAMLGFVGTFIIYIMSQKGSVLFTGALISLVSGGLVGIISYFFNVGTAGYTGK